jgi:hypothetical protein
MILLLFLQCSQENPYLIEKGKVGLLNTNTAIHDLSEIFSKDSIVSLSAGDGNENSLIGSGDEYLIFSKNGDKLLEIVPNTQNDSLSGIKSIQVFDAKYQTESGISLRSTFKDINENYMVNKVETTLTSAMLYIDELNATIAIDKKDLGVAKFSREEISINQIPDLAKVKYFTIWFN